MNDQQLGLSLISEYDGQIAALQKQKIEAVAALKSEAVAKMKHEIALLGITAAELGFVGVEGSATHRAASAVAASESAGNKVEPKYIDPVSGKTWTGRGKAPKWIEGKDRAPFLIASPAVTATPATQPQDPVQEPSDTTGEFTKPKVTREPVEEAA